MTVQRQSFWSTAAAYLGGAAAVQLINFVAQPAFALLMAPGEWGAAATYLFWMTAFGLVIGLQGQSALNNIRTSHGERGAAAFVAALVPWYLLPLGLVVLTIAAAPGFWGRTLGLSAPYLFLAAVNGALFAIGALAMGHAIALGRRRRYLMLLVGNTLLPLVIGFPLVLLMPDDRILGRVLGYVLGSLVVALLVARDALTGRVPGDRALLVLGVPLVLPLLAHEVLYLVTSQSNRVFLTTLDGADAAGVFAFAFGLANIAVVAAAAVNSAWTPWYFAHTASQEHQRVRRTGGLLIMGFATLLSAASLVSPEALRLISRASYGDGALVVPALLVSGQLLLLFNLAANYAIYTRRTRLVLLVSATGCAINVSLNLLLIPRLSITGAAIASVAASCWLAATMTVLARCWLRSPNHPVAATVGAVTLTLASLLLTELFADRPLVRALAAAALLLVSAGAALTLRRRSGRLAAAAHDPSPE